MVVLRNYEQVVMIMYILLFLVALSRIENISQVHTRENGRSRPTIETTHFIPSQNLTFTILVCVSTSQTTARKRKVCL